MWIGKDSWSRVAGVRDLATQEPFSLDDRVRCASITKSFCATAVLQLVDAGALSLDDRLDRFVPGIAGGDRITIEMMLGMRSGIYDFTSDETFLAAFETDPAMAWSDERTVDVIRAGTPAFEPGAKVVYADSNYALLGVVLRQVTGRPPGEVITEKVVAPLGLTATSYPTSPAMPEPHPTGYVPVLVGGDPNAPFDNAASPPRVVNEVNPDVPSTAGAMVSSLDDLRAWGRELGDGTLLSPASQERRIAASARLDGQQLNLGYGLGVLTLNEFLGHDGAIYGYSTIVLRRPQTDTTIVLVANESTNSTTPTFAIAFSMIAALYPDQAT
jgi:D-alanyl-D-alanine carboxypeptidase